jgi:hypothetical protein
MPLVLTCRGRFDEAPYFHVLALRSRDQWLIEEKLQL